jgi:hypothetical protein
MNKKVPLIEYFNSPLAVIQNGEKDSIINYKIYDQRRLIPLLVAYVEKDINYLSTCAI